MDFRRAMTTNDTFTENAMPTHSTSSNYLLDMFFKMGASRGLGDGDLTQMFQRAFSEDRLLATKAVFYNRDVRGGQGERRSFRVFFNYLATHYPEIARKNLHNIPYYGRWDDVFAVFDTPVEDTAIDMILHALTNGDKLCAKWMPREGKSKNAIAKKLMKAFDLSPRDYRKLLAGNTQVVENLMCKNDWDKINYEHVPSIAMHKYRTAFFKHDPEGMANFLKAVEKGEKKINASAIFPHDVIMPYLTWNNPKDDGVIEAQWKALPDYMPKGKKILPICDVSGSMTGLPMAVSVSLGLYLAERNEGPFQNMFITFSGKPTLQIIRGNNLRERVMHIHNADWGMNTNIEAVFKLILNQAVKYSLPANEMPQTILILSDMQFDSCRQNYNDNVFEMMARMYRLAGYELPQIVFWNLRASTGFPVKYDEHGTAMVSGFSPSILKSIFSGDIEPMKVMLRTLNNERYSRVTI